MTKKKEAKVRGLKKKELKDILALKEKYKAKMREEGEGIVTGLLEDFLAETPEVEAVVWTQYTPHFNDGEPCTFGVHEARVRLSKEATPDWLRKNLNEHHTFHAEERKYVATAADVAKQNPHNNSWGIQVGKQYSRTVYEKAKTDEELLEYIGPEGGDYEDGAFESYNFSDKSSFRKKIQELSNDIHSCSDILELVCGDGVQVIVTRDGMEIEEIDHD
jgi:hypothetical protein